MTPFIGPGLLRVGGSGHAAAQPVAASPPTLIAPVPIKGVTSSGEGAPRS